VPHMPSCSQCREKRTSNIRVSVGDRGMYNLAHHKCHEFIGKSEDDVKFQCSRQGQEKEVPFSGAHCRLLSSRSSGRLWRGGSRDSGRHEKS